MRNRHFRLSQKPLVRTIRILSGTVTMPADDSKITSVVTVTRCGSFTDPRYGRFEITREMLFSMVRNFDAGTVGVDIFLDVSHKPEDGAAAKILKLTVEGSRLRALVEWTGYGVDAVKVRGYRYLSAEFVENYQDNEQGAQYGCTLLGAGLTVRPVIKHLDPVTLSCESGDDVPILIHPDLAKHLLSEAQNTMNKHLLALLAQLQAKKLSESAINAIMKAAGDAVALAGEDEAVQIKLCNDFASAAITLADSLSAGGTIQLSMPGTSITTDQVQTLIAKALTDQAAEAKALAETLTARRMLLADTINAAAGIDDAVKKELTESAAKLVTGDMSEDQVKALAQMQINSGNKIAASVKLAMMGYQVSGNPHITVPDEGAVKLSQIYHDHLKKTDTYANGGIKLSDKASVFLSKVLAEFDRINGFQIDQEAKLLSGGQTTMNNVALPIGFQREVIREALSDLRILELVQTLTDFGATATTGIPYEFRDVSGILNDGIVYEGQEIGYATVHQAMDTAYLTPMKVAYIISNEVAHFTRASGLNWDAMSRNIETCSSVMREMVCRRLANELQRSADAYGAIVVSAESFTSQLDGSKSTIKTTNFPIVRPYQARDLQGAAVGSPENAIAVVLNNNAIAPFDGSGTQTAGTYYRITNYNLGYVQFVNQLGDPVTPANTGTNTIAYSRATNIVKVNLDVPDGSTLELQLNKALQAVGSQKAMLSGQRFVTPNFLLMSPTLNDTLSNAEQFINEFKRNGTDNTTDGDLMKVKGIAAYGTNAPGIDLGDQRIVIGQRGTLTYTVAKPFALGEPFEAVGPNGKPIGKKQAYGEEYNAIKTPTPIRNRLASVLVYSFTNR